MAFVPTQLEPPKVCTYCGKSLIDCRCAEDEEDEELNEEQEANRNKQAADLREWIRDRGC